MKKDALTALAGALAIAGITYGLAAMRPPFKPRTSEPFAPPAVGKSEMKHVVMRVNGEPVTQEEFQATFDALPDELKRQFASQPGQQAFAEQLIRMKLLEQEGRRLGVDRDPRVAAQLSAERTNIIASAAAEKIVSTPTAEAVKNFYDANKARFQVREVSHILIAYQGGSVPPRNGGVAPPQANARALAQKVYEHLRGGADFAATAAQVSDDVASVETGGKLGSFSRGMLPPEVEARVFSLKEGQISEPVQSRFGLHIFKVDKMTTAPLAQVTQNISRHVKQQNTFSRVEVLRKSAKVEFDPKFFPEAKKWSEPPATPPTKRPS